MLSTFFHDKFCRFTVWAPEKKHVILHIVAPFDKEFPMVKNEEGYFSVEVETVEKELQYFFKPDGINDFPDPASQYQPDGVHGPSQTIDHSSFNWNDGNWKSIPINEMIIYELHVGTFTPEGTFEAIIDRLDDLKDVGINALELMPVFQFPGNRNWGYDGVYPYAVQNSYGAPEGLKKLVNACHQKGISVILDVVYNHLGPEGNYFSQFGPYFTTRYNTPWGDAINFDDAWSDGVREYFSGNVIHWLENYHIDALRFDAIHAIFDIGAVHFWALTHQKVKHLEDKMGRRFYLIAESDLNDPKIVKMPEQGGYGFDAQWLDDFHHALYTLINPEDKQRYYDFGSIDQLVKGYNEGFVHSGEWVKFRKKKYGASSANFPGDKFVIFIQNHDQIGNRADGKRLCSLVDFEKLKLASAAVFLAPYIPMLFMGEEYGDESPFLYFISHSDRDLIKAVQEGRNKEFADFGFDDNVADPQDENTFRQSILQWDKRNKDHHKMILEWHKELIRMRKTFAPLKDFDKRNLQAKVINENSFVLYRHTAGMEESMMCLFNFSEEEVEYAPALTQTAIKVFDSKDRQWTTQNKNADPHPDQVKPNQKISLQPSSVVVYHSR